jgi:hypothetical protein
MYSVGAVRRCITLRQAIWRFTGAKKTKTRRLIFNVWTDWSYTGSKPTSFIFSMTSGQARV